MAASSCWSCPLKVATGMFSTSMSGDALVLDQPVSVQVEIRVLGRTGIAVVDQTIPVRQPDAGTRCALAKQRGDVQDLIPCEKVSPSE